MLLLLLLPLLLPSVLPLSLPLLPLLLLLLPGASVAVAAKPAWVSLSCQDSICHRKKGGMQPHCVHACQFTAQEERRPAGTLRPCLSHHCSGRQEACTHTAPVLVTFTLSDTMEGWCHQVLLNSWVAGPWPMAQSTCLAASN